MKHPVMAASMPNYHRYIGSKCGNCLIPTGSDETLTSTVNLLVRSSTGEGRFKEGSHLLTRRRFSVSGIIERAFSVCRSVVEVS